MNRFLQTLTRPIPHGRAWLRYGFAAAISLVAWLITEASRNGAQPSSPFLAGFGALMLAILWAGAGPGVVATLGCTAWAGFHLREQGALPGSVAVRCLVFLGEGLSLCFSGAYLARLSGKAAQDETRYRRLVETTSEGIWTHDGAGTITWANARMAEMLGVPLDALSGRRVDEFYFPSDLTMERIRAESLGAGIRQQFDRRLRRVDGTELWVLACCNGFADDAGPSGARATGALAMDASATGALAMGALAMMTDITERKRAEHALRRSEHRYRSLFENILEGVYQSTPDGRILAANPMLLRMLGCANEAELRQLNIAHDLYVDAEIRRRLLEQLERDGGFQNVEYELRTAKGNIIRVLENARVIRDENGEVLHYEGTLTDITERKRVEEQLRQAQKVEALGRLAGGVARDFDGVLRVVISRLDEVLREIQPDHRARGPAEQALRSATGATALTEQLLSFSRRPAEFRDADFAAVPDPGRETILLVEGDPLVRELSRDMLERQGYRVFLASGEVEAEQIGSNTAFDLLIADTRMPTMTGVELARKLRAMNPGLKTLFVSGYGDPSLEQAAKQDGTVPGDGGVLQKPFSAESLGRRIRQIFGKS